MPIQLVKEKPMSMRGKWDRKKKKAEVTATSEEKQGEQNSDQEIETEKALKTSADPKTTELPVRNDKSEKSGVSGNSSSDIRRYFQVQQPIQQIHHIPEGLNSENIGENMGVFAASINMPAPVANMGTIAGVIQPAPVANMGIFSAPLQEGSQEKALQLLATSPTAPAATSTKIPIRAVKEMEIPRRTSTSIPASPGKQLLMEANVPISAHADDNEIPISGQEMDLDMIAPGEANVSPAKTRVQEIPENPDSMDIDVPESFNVPELVPVSSAKNLGESWNPQDKPIEKSSEKCTLSDSRPRDLTGANELTQRVEQTPAQGMNANSLPSIPATVIPLTAPAPATLELNTSKVPAAVATSTSETIIDQQNSVSAPVSTTSQTDSSGEVLQLHPLPDPLLHPAIPTVEEAANFLISIFMDPRTEPVHDPEESTSAVNDSALRCPLCHLSIAQLRKNRSQTQEEVLSEHIEFGCENSKFDDESDDVESDDDEPNDDQRMPYYAEFTPPRSSSSPWASKLPSIISIQETYKVMLGNPDLTPEQRLGIEDELVSALHAAQKDWHDLEEISFQLGAKRRKLKKLPKGVERPRNPMLPEKFEIYEAAKEAELYSADNGSGSTRAGTRNKSRKIERPLAWGYEKPSGKGQRDPSDVGHTRDYNAREPARNRDTETEEPTPDAEAPVKRKPGRPPKNRDVATTTASSVTAASPAVSNTATPVQTPLATPAVPGPNPGVPVKRGPGRPRKDGTAPGSARIIPPKPPRQLKYSISSIIPSAASTPTTPVVRPAPVSAPVQTPTIQTPTIQSHLPFLPLQGTFIPIPTTGSPLPIPTTPATATPTTAPVGSATTTPTTIPKKRGRPRKNPTPQGPAAAPPAIAPAIPQKGLFYPPGQQLPAQGTFPPPPAPGFPTHALGSGMSMPPVMSPGIPGGPGSPAGPMNTQLGSGNFGMNGFQGQIGYVPPGAQIPQGAIMIGTMEQWVAMQAAAAAGSPVPLGSGNSLPVPIQLGALGGGQGVQLLGAQQGQQAHHPTLHPQAWQNLQHVQALLQQQHQQQQQGQGAPMAMMVPQQVQQVQQVQKPQQPQQPQQPQLSQPQAQPSQPQAHQAQHLQPPQAQQPPAQPTPQTSQTPKLQSESPATKTHPRGVRGKTYKTPIAIDAAEVIPVATLEDQYRLAAAGELGGPRIRKRKAIIVDGSDSDDEEEDEGASVVVEESSSRGGGRGRGRGRGSRGGGRGRGKRGRWG
ncbi:hypothetical protein FPQ18DRAFT_411544 [Pyronema domesticum]|nr:hypothetical protein FPQ18DRAFT_411544 [Pyronema domesticum]